MDEKRFDTMARGLARLASRRRVVGGVLGGALTLLTGPSAIAIRGKLRRGNRGGHGQDETTTSDVLAVAGTAHAKTMRRLPRMRSCERSTSRRPVHRRRCCVPWPGCRPSSTG